MSIASYVRADGDKLIIDDEDGGIWHYAKGKLAPGDPALQVDWTWTPVGFPPALVPGPDGKPLLRQAEKGLPNIIIVGMVDSTPRIAGAPVPGGFVGGGRYEFEKIVPQGKVRERCQDPFRALHRVDSSMETNPMEETLTVRGRYVGRTFIPDGPLPDEDGTAELVIRPTRPQARGSIADAFGRAAVPRSGDDILAQVRAERDEWGDR